MPNKRQLDSTVAHLDAALARNPKAARVGSGPPSASPLSPQNRLQTLPEDSREPSFSPLRQQQGARRRSSSLSQRDNSLDPCLASLSLQELGQLEDGEEEVEIDVFSSQTYPDPTLALVSKRVRVQTYVFNTLWAKVLNIYNGNPNHPMFGHIEFKKCKIPLRGPAPEVKGRSKANDVSWYRKLKVFSENVALKMGGKDATIVEGSCWMWSAAANKLMWQKKISKPKVPGEVTGVYFRIMPVRLFAFLNDPIPRNWMYATAEKEGIVDATGRQFKSIENPFAHTYHNGQGSKGKDAASVTYYVNGIEHGFFTSLDVNNAMKGCNKEGRGRWNCPGHEGYSCVYMDQADNSGRYLPCLNTDTPRSIEYCTYFPYCFPIPPP